MPGMCLSAEGEDGAFVGCDEFGSPAYIFRCDAVDAFDYLFARGGVSVEQNGAAGGYGHLFAVVAPDGHLSDILLFCRFES